MLATTDKLLRLIISITLITIIPIVKIQELKGVKSAKKAEVLKFITSISTKVTILVNCGMNPRKALEVTLRNISDYELIRIYAEEMRNCLTLGMKMEEATIVFCLYAREEYVLRFFSLLIQTQKGGNLHLKMQLMDLTNQIYIDKNLYFMIFENYQICISDYERQK